MPTPLRTAAVAGAVALALPAAAAPAAAAPAGERGTLVLHAVAAFDPAGTAGAYTYDPALVPAGARAAVVSVSGRERTRTLLAVHGLVPDRAYGVHLHVNPCGAAPADAGPHYQQVPDPVKPSVDPAYANPENEVWLDVHTDAAGNAVVRSLNPWRYRAAPASLVIHTEHTHTEPGKAGTAGARLACLTLT
ncbi:superoxide dismutase [Kineococcus sp. NUM-3379]